MFIPKSLKDFRKWYPGFFSRSNRKFFKDAKYYVKNGYLIVQTGHGYSIYAPYITESNEQELIAVDVMCRNMENIKIKCKHSLFDLAKADDLKRYHQSIVDYYEKQNKDNPTP